MLLPVGPIGAGRRFQTPADDSGGCSSLLPPPPAVTFITGLRLLTVTRVRLVGVRVPNHPFIRELARACSGPLALTSANISCQGSTLMVSEFQDLWPQLSLIIDGGQIGDAQSPEARLGSTVVDLSVSGKFAIIRPGCALTSTVEILRQKYGLVPESSEDFRL
nr:PREDICTED: yrdC domain-containing protein, mitochondrial [Opisthocomus hoazin]